MSEGRLEAEGRKSLGPGVLWNRLGPLHEHPPSFNGGALRRKDRKCMAGFVYAPRTASPWQALDELATSKHDKEMAP